MTRRPRTAVHLDWRCMRLFKRSEIWSLAAKACYLARAANKIAELFDVATYLDPHRDILDYDAYGASIVTWIKTLVKALREMGDALRDIQAKSEFACVFTTRLAINAVAGMLDRIADAVYWLYAYPDDSTVDMAHGLINTAIQLVNALLGPLDEQPFEPKLAIRSMDAEVGICRLIEEEPPERLWKPLSWDDIAAGFRAVFG